MLGEDFVADGLDEVGFAKTDAAMDVERVVFSAWFVGDSAASGESEAIVIADDEIIKSIFGVEVGVVGFGASWLGANGFGEI